MANFIDTPIVEKKKTSLLAQTFGWVFIGLLITTVLTVGLAFIMTSLLNNANPVQQEAILNNYLIALGVSSVIQFVLVLVIQFAVIRKGPTTKNMLVPYVIYAANMGVLLSFLALVIEFDILAASLGITMILFAFMYLIAKQTKRNLSGLAIVGSSLMLGGLALLLFNFLFRSSELDWLISFVLFGAIMLITMFDIWRITKISETGETSPGLALYFAFTLYVDFIYILIRIIYFIGLSRRR